MNNLDFAQFNVVLDNTSYSSKPSARDIRKFANQILAGEIQSESHTLSEIYTAIENGKTSYLTGFAADEYGNVLGIDKSSFQEKQIFVIDVDNPSPEEAQEKSVCSEFVRRDIGEYKSIQTLVKRSELRHIPITAAAHSFSSDPSGGSERYHLFFVADRCIYRLEEAEAISRRLWLLFGDDVTGQNINRATYSAPHSFIFKTYEPFSVDALLDIDIDESEYIIPNSNLAIKPLPKDIEKQTLEAVDGGKTTINGFYDFLKFINNKSIYDFLPPNTPKGNNFCCVFHHDHHPSAYVNHWKGKEYYHCRTCGLDLDLMGFVQKQNDFQSTSEVIRFLCKHYDLSFFASEFSVREKARCLTAKNWSIDSFANQAPKAYWLLQENSCLDMLDVVLATWEKSIIPRGGNVFCGKTAFFASTRHLDAQIGYPYLSNSSKALSLLCYLGIARKMTSDDVHSMSNFFWSGAKAEQNKKGQQYEVNFLQVNSFWENAEELEQKAQQFLSLYSFSQFGYLSVFVREGQVVADTLFPMIANGGECRSIRFRTLVIEHELLSRMNFFGWASREQLIDEAVKTAKISKESARKCLEQLSDLLCKKYRLEYRMPTNVLRSVKHIPSDCKSKIFISYWCTHDFTSECASIAVQIEEMRNEYIKYLYLQKNK